jgi:hypothetical protein
MFFPQTSVFLLIACLGGWWELKHKLHSVK